MLTKTSHELVLGMIVVGMVATSCAEPAKYDPQNPPTNDPRDAGLGGQGGNPGPGRQFDSGPAEVVMDALTTQDASMSDHAVDTDVGPSDSADAVVGSTDGRVESTPSQAPPGGSWIRTTVTGPTARYYVRLSYAGAGKFITLGGNCLDVAGTCDDRATWEYDSGTGAWTKHDTGQMPAFRSDYGLTYDSARSRVVLFGGSPRGGPLLGDVWEWNGQEKSWAQVTPQGTPRPSPRTRPQLSYDSARSRTVLFGGDVQGAEVLEPSKDTWEWDGAVWMKKEPAVVPSSAYVHGMAYMPTRRTVILVADNAGRNGVALWSWDGTNWSAAPGDGDLSRAPGRRNYGVAYAGGDYLLLFGGYRDVSPRGSSDDETWQWDGRTWSKVSVAGPPSGREFMGLAYDERRSRVILFGGAQWQVDSRRYLPLGDTWEFHR